MHNSQKGNRKRHQNDVHLKIKDLKCKHCKFPTDKFDKLNKHIKFRHQKDYLNSGRLLENNSTSYIYNDKITYYYSDISIISAILFILYLTEDPLRCNTVY